LDTWAVRQSKDASLHLKCKSNVLKSAPLRCLLTDSHIKIFLFYSVKMELPVDLAAQVAGSPRPARPATAPLTWVVRMQTAHCK
jgi:hypothetical protein